jgi:nucleoside-diphosphate-sugar epimerase
MSRRVLVTGLNGFIGRSCAAALKERGHVIHAVLREGSPAPEGISAVYSPDIFSESVSWWADACSGMDSVLHLAWHTVPGSYQADPTNFHCLEGTLRLAQGAAKAGVTRFAAVGTCLEYEGADEPLLPSSPLRPTSAYGAAKAAAFLALSYMLPLAGVSFTWCRLFHLYGKGEHQDRLTPYLHRCLSRGQIAELSSGRQTRDYMDVKVASSRLAELLLSDFEGPANVCSGKAVTIRAFAESIGDHYGRRDLLHFGARPDNPAEPPFIVGVPTQFRST